MYAAQTDESNAEHDQSLPFRQIVLIDVHEPLRYFSTELC